MEIKKHLYLLELVYELGVLEYDFLIGTEDEVRELADNVAIDQELFNEELGGMPTLSYEDQGVVTRYGDTGVPVIS